MWEKEARSADLGGLRHERGIGGGKEILREFERENLRRGEVGCWIGRRAQGQLNPILGDASGLFTVSHIFHYFVCYSAGRFWVVYAPFAASYFSVSLFGLKNW